MLAYERHTLVPQDMPALRWIRQEYDRDGALSGMRVWAHQHLLGNTMGLLNAMGLDPKRTTLLGKRYSLDARVGWAFRLHGYQVVGDSVPQSRARIEAQLRAELSRIRTPEAIKRPKFLLLDDGGELIEVVANYVRQHFPRHAHLFAAVEQTTHGINRLKNTRPPFVVVGSAKSVAKRKYAAPMHGYAIVKHSLPTVRERARSFPSEFPSRASVLGYGAIGAEVARQLRRAGYRVKLYDSDRAKLERALQETERGLPRYRLAERYSEALTGSEVVYLCVGKPLRTAQEMALTASINTQFVNAASWDEVIDQNTRKPLFVNGGLNLNDVQYVQNGRTVLFHRSGGVVNFPFPRIGKTNPEIPIPGRYIQLDLGLLYLGMLQAARGGPKRIIDLAAPPQERLVNYVEHQLKQRGESLLEPRW
jgi:hypothetical protein